MGQIKKFWEVKAIENGGAEILIYGEIGDLRFFGEDFYDVSAKRIAEELKGLGEVSEISVRINSPGGSVWSAQAIYSLLKGHSAKVTVHVDGIAASAASLIAMAGDEIIMPENTMMMIHSPMIYGSGNSSDLRDLADRLDKSQQSMIAVYSRSGQPEDKIKEMLEAETWLTAAEAVDLGFADRTEEAMEITASMDSGMVVLAGGCGGPLKLDPSRYRHLPEAFLPAAEQKEPVKAKASKTPAPEGQGKKTEVARLTLEELKAQDPELFEEVMKAGAEGERERIKAIDGLGAVASGKLAMEAKYDNPCSAEALAMKIVQAQTAQGKQVLSDIRDDARDLPDVDVDPSAAAARGSETDAREEAEVVASMSDGMKRRKK